MFKSRIVTLLFTSGLFTSGLVTSGLVTSANLAAAGTWEVARQNEDITAYTQYSETLGYNAVKFETVVDVSVETLVSFNTEPENFNQWMESFDQVEILKRDTWYDYHLYVTYDFPFPYQNRDSISHTSLFRKNDGTVIVKFVGEEEGKPLNEDYVRMDYIQGAWEFIPLEENKTKIVYTSLVSPGGDGPKWVINAFSLDVPFASLENLIESMKTYQPRSISMDEIPLEKDS
ncbi:START domain-containing protein [Litoribacillus peritrichatus]|uniref:START domain-containing protein n=1 Tax=Litoribacillus peritrichatus TaxID=718191 RepID=A0ABP7M7Q9_9GAMM